VLVAPLRVALQSYSVAPWEWRNQRELPRHQVKNAVLTGLGHTMARQRASVAPVVLARQAYCTTTVLALTCHPLFVKKSKKCKLKLRILGLAFRIINSEVLSGF